VLANVFGPSVFAPEILRDLHEKQMFDPSALLPALPYAVTELSPIFFIAVVWLFWTALRGYRTSRLAAILFLFQALVVAWKFRFEFRFLGGLEYIAVIVMALTLAKEAIQQRIMLTTVRRSGVSGVDGWRDHGIGSC
jgi:hypothetical protein